MNKSILSLLIVGGLVFSISTGGQTVQAQGLSFQAEMNKSFTPPSIEPGGISRLDVTIFNPNPFPLTSASWTDDLASVELGIFIANPPNISNTCGGTVAVSADGTSLKLSGGTVPEQQGAIPGSCTVSIDVTSTHVGNTVNTIPAQALSSTGDGKQVTNPDPASATLHVEPTQSPTLSKSFSPNTMLVGQVSQLTIRIRNNDFDTALTEALLTDPLPPNVVLANPVSGSLSNCGSSASLGATSGGSTVTLSNGTIAPNSTCVIRVNVTSTVSGLYTNTISPSALKTHQGLTNASPASANLNVQDVGISKSFSPSNFQAGGVTTLTITLRNPTKTPYTGVELADTLPGNVLTVVPGSATTTCGGTASTILPRTVKLLNGTVPAGTPTSPGTCTISVQVTAPADATSATYTNVIPENSLKTDQKITNGIRATARVTVYATGSGVTASKSFSPATIMPGENSLLQIKIKAPADTDLTNFSITDNLPADVTISNSQPATRNNCGPASILTADTGANFIRLTKGTIPAGTTCEINVYVTSSVPGVHTNIITPSDITNNENRTIPNNITADLTVQTVSLFSASKAFTPPAVAPGGISTLTITLRNTNTVPLVNVSVTDPLPGTPTDGVIVAPIPNASTTCVGGSVTAASGTQTISMTGGTIPAQLANVPGTCTINVDVQGMGSVTTFRNIIPTVNISGTVQGTNIVQNPAQPAQADLQIVNLIIGVVKKFDPLIVYGGSASTLSVELTNPNNVSLNGIAFKDQMPPGMIVADPAKPDVGNCGGSIDAVPGADTFSFSGGTLTAASSCTMKLSVTMTVQGALDNIIDPGAVTSANGARNQELAKVSLVNLPGASISKAFTPSTIKAGSAAALTITIRNTGSVALSGMGFDDKLPGDLPVGLKIAESPAPVNNCGGTLTSVPGTQLIKLENGSLGMNASCTIVVSITGDVQGTYVNTIDAGKLQTNERATNHSATSDTLTVTGTTPSGGGTNNGGGGKKKPSNPSKAVTGFLVPVTGFPADVITHLDSLSRPRYDALGMTIEIPVLHVNTSIVGVQINNGGWDVSWLQNQLGWLNGTAYPTWKGNSVLTGHVVNADGKPGILSRLKYLKPGELIFVKNGGYRYTYQVVSNQFIQPDDATAFRHEDKSYLTLITCDNYDLQSASYLSRVAVGAKLVDVRQMP